MSFMSLHITPKGALYSADCRKCGATIYVHEWAHPDPNGARDAMRDGALCCDLCAIGCADPETFVDHGRKYYAARYIADGYLDCTDWNYGTNKRALLMISGCNTLPTHNSHGGYVDACGELPPLLGDDC